MTRVSASERVKLQSRAEREIMRFAGEHGLWHKHVHGVDLDAMQLLKMQAMDEFNNTIDYSCRRTGKTACKELWDLEYLATNADQELGVVAPREAQSIVNINYHTDAIRRSDILENFVDYKNGRKQLTDTGYQFANRSRAQAYGIMSQIDGSDLTLASLEEVDDMPPDRLYSRFLLTMGATRRLGAANESINDPIIRITGVFKGADTLNEMVESGKYKVLPVIDAYLGMEMGIINEQFMLDMRDQLSHEEFLRQLLCLNVSGRNLVWEKWKQRAIHRGLKARVEVVEPLPYQTYKKRGLIAFGYDHTGHGETPESSKSALVVGELVGNYMVTLYARTWPPGVDDVILQKDLLSAWSFFRPDYAIGDAYGVGMLTALNDDLFTSGLTETNRAAVGDGDSTASAWPEWPFSPMRFEGMVKHQMAQMVKQIFHRDLAVLPYVDDRDDDPLSQDIATLARQVVNIKPSPVKASSYNTYSMVNKKLGDDLFDAYMAMVWAFATRGAGKVPTVVSSQAKTREQLLGGTESLLQLGVR